RTLNVTGTREKVGSQVVQKTGIQCFNCKEYGHFAKECRKPKKVKEYAYHKEKMLLCKQAEQGVSFQAEQYDWLADTNEEVDEQELEAHYSYMAKIQEVPNADSGTDSEPVEQIVELILFIVDSGCTKHMTDNLKLLCNFVEKFLGTVRFGNDQFAPILGYGDLVQGNVTINRVYYVEGLNYNLFSVGQFCDADLKVTFRKSTCFVRDLQGYRDWSAKAEICQGSTIDGENLNKIKEKRDPCILVGCLTQSKGYRVYNKRTRMIVESIHIRFDEIKEVLETSVANNTSGLVPQREKASDYDNPDPVPQRQDVYSSADTDVPSQQELDMLFGPLYDEFFNAGS
nr:integrase, catalytic region, zinc finger, CCHC-type, peptidase aspartic, catalytic [Tanacetum cinerariifolium]